MPHLLFLTETQIRCPPDAAYLNYPGYSLEHHFLQRAGVCVYVRNDICCRRLRHLEDPSLSTLWLLVDTGMDKIVYACVYRSHSGDQETTRLFDHLSEAADMALHRHPDAQFVALGDFNACHQDWLFPYQRTDHAGREARNFAVAMGLSQLVKQATRVPDVVGHTANCLDLLLTTDPDRCIVTVSSPIGTSDHCLVKSVSTFSPPDCDSRGERRMWRYKSADWDEMRHFFASYPWQQVCFSSEDPSSCADAISDVVRQAMEYYIPYSDVPVGGSAHPWFNADCAEAEKRKHSAFLAWADARDRKAPDLSSKKRAFNHAAKSYKKALRRARFDRITHIGKKLSAQPSGSRAFWSLAKSVEANFCRPTLPPLVKPDGTLAHTAREKAGLFASLFAHNSRLDTSSATPPSLPHCDSSMSEVRISTAFPGAGSMVGGSQSDEVFPSPNIDISRPCSFSEGAEPVKTGKAPKRGACTSLAPGNPAAIVAGSSAGAGLAVAKAAAKTNKSLTNRSCSALTGTSTEPWRRRIRFSLLSRHGSSARPAPQRRAHPDQCSTETVSGLTLSASAPLVVRSQSEILKRVRCGIAIPDDQGLFGDSQNIGRALSYQNPWVDVSRWLLLHADKQNACWFLILGIPEDQIQTLMDADRRFCLGPGRVYVKFQGLNGRFVDVPRGWDRVTGQLQCAGGNPPTTSDLAAPVADNAVTVEPAATAVTVDAAPPSGGEPDDISLSPASDLGEPGFDEGDLFAGLRLCGDEVCLPPILPRRNPRNTDRVVYARSLESKLVLPSDSMTNRGTTLIDALVDQLTESILTSYHTACPETLPRDTPGKQPWWGADLERKRSKVRKALNRAMNTCTDEAWDAYYAAKSSYKKCIRFRRTTGWRKFCGSIESCQQANRVRKVLAQQNTPEIATLRKPDNTLTWSPEEARRILVETHFPDCVFAQVADHSEENQTTSEDDWSYASRNSSCPSRSNILA
ncbi:hypothetical protein PYW07_003284 [Mythimna separata]|uniref:Endonuclease/exonuclease/phosphatase domain-containing protein n=2 Tax=Mythimna separata TaxID=271217 RepID=A0AAD7YHN3_MYTSE|nr:hypothetical protein PYW07_003284 [Mythimna separata]